MPVGTEAGLLTVAPGAFRCNICEAFTRVDAGKLEPRCNACESTLDLSGRPQESDALSLARAIALSPVPMLVDFWSPWCSPCVLSAPIVKALASTLAGEIVVLTVNTQEAEEAAETHAIYAIPTFAIFAHGEELSRQIGLLPHGMLESWVRAAIHPGCASGSSRLRGKRSSPDVA